MYNGFTKKKCRGALKVLTLVFISVRATLIKNCTWPNDTVPPNLSFFHQHSKKICLKLFILPSR